MTSESRQTSPGLTGILRRLARTSVDALQNRLELFALEWKQERARLTSVLMVTVLLLFFGILGTLMLTVMVLLFMPLEWRPWAAGAFGLIYSGAAAAAWFALKKLIDQDTFPESLDQIKRDALWVDSLDKRN